MSAAQSSAALTGRVVPMAGFTQLLGRLGGVLLAPVTASVSAARRARMFHPKGVVLRAQVRPAASEPQWSAIAARLEGPALVRMSSAWWKRREWKDVLGVAIRFTREVRADGGASPGDQDLLFATIRRPWTTPFAPLSTDPHDFFGNDYYAVSPFRAGGALVEWRLVPARRAWNGAGDREERLGRALAAGDAVFLLEGRRRVRARRFASSRRWHRVARVSLVEAIDVDQSRLRFDPFRAGRGLVPVGFVHALRRATYGASQLARGRVRPSRVVREAEVRARGEVERRA